MVSTVSSRPNYYEALGLSPTASQDDIAKAFGKAMGLFGARSVSAAAQLGIAFETLRNPAKRRDYDASIGLAPEPQPVRAPTSVSFRISARAAGLEPHVEQRVPSPAPKADPAPEPGPASFIASSLREIARPVTLERAPAAKKPEPEPPPQREQVERMLAADEEDRPIDWRKPAVAVGSVVLAAGLVGALAGVSVKDDEQGQRAPAVTAALPAAKPRPNVTPPTTAAPQADASPALVRTVAEEPQRAVRAQRLSKRPQEIAAMQPPTPAGEQASAAQPVDAADGSAQADTPAADPLAPQPQSQAIETVAATGLPLAGKLVARTIERIGYACGEVASAESAGAGVYKVTCTSGQIYQARPVHGRYRFRRWGSR